jgi:imidazolonepropionase-like amidohydrolase
LTLLEGRDQQLKDLTMRTDFGFTPAELMVQATGNGEKNRCFEWQAQSLWKGCGVIEAGAMADILIYSKNPLEDITIIEDHETNLKLIMKDGDIL